MIHDRQNCSSITVVLPNYNHANFIQSAILGLLRQTRPANEIIIVDDASTDNSLAVIEQLAFGFDNIQVVRREQRGGAIRAMAEGLRRATGNLVALVAADDVTYPDFLAETEALMLRFPDAPFCSACVEIRDGNDRLGGHRPLLRPALRPTYVAPADARALLRRGDNFFLGGVTLYRRGCVLKLGGFDESLGSMSDGMLQRRLAVRWGFCFVPRTLGIWRIHGSNYSVTSVADPKLFDQLIERSKQVLDHEPAGLFPPAYTKLFERRMRFGAGRLAVAAVGRRGNDIQRLHRIVRANPLDRFVFRIASLAGTAAPILAMAWITMKLRPFSFSWLALESIRARGRR